MYTVYVIEHTVCSTGARDIPTSYIYVLYSKNSEKNQKIKNSVRMQYVCSARGNNVNICVRILRNVYIFENSENFKISPILAIFKFAGQFQRSTELWPVYARKNNILK